MAVEPRPPRARGGGIGGRRPPGAGSRHPGRRRRRAVAGSPRADPRPDRTATRDRGVGRATARRRCIADRGLATGTEHSRRRARSRWARQRSARATDAGGERRVCPTSCGKRLAPSARRHRSQAPPPGSVSWRCRATGMRASAMCRSWSRRAAGCGRASPPRWCGSRRGSAPMSSTGAIDGCGSAVAVSRSPRKAACGCGPRCRNCTPRARSRPATSWPGTRRATGCAAPSSCWGNFGAEVGGLRPVAIGGSGGDSAAASRCGRADAGRRPAASRPWTAGDRVDRGRADGGHSGPCRGARRPPLPAAGIAALLIFGWLLAAYAALDVRQILADFLAPILAVVLGYGASALWTAHACG